MSRPELAKLFLMALGFGFTVAGLTAVAVMLLSGVPTTA